MSIPRGRQAASEMSGIYGTTSGVDVPGMEMSACSRQYVVLCHRGLYRRHGDKHIKTLGHLQRLTVKRCGMVDGLDAVVAMKVLTFSALSPPFWIVHDTGTYQGKATRVSCKDMLASKTTFG